MILAERSLEPQVTDPGSTQTHYDQSVAELAGKAKGKTKHLIKPGYNQKGVLLEMPRPALRGTSVNDLAGGEELK